MELTKKHRVLICIFYGIITATANFLGAVLPISFAQPTLESLYMTEWLAFLEQYSKFINYVTAGTFIVPSLLCFIYAFKKNKERFINLPIAYSLLGATGWIFYLLAEIVTLFIAKQARDIAIMNIFFTSLMFSGLELLLSFTITYFTLETLHRKIFLPRYFPDGHLKQYKKVKNPSLRFLFFAFYCSAGLFPTLYILSAYITTHLNNNITVNTNTLIILFFLVLFGVGLCIIFLDYFDTPLRKLKAGTEKIKSGDFNTRVNVVSADSFGDLADSFNEMTETLESKTKKIVSIQNSIVTGMAVMVESRDNSTGGHIKRTSDCVRIFIEQLKKSEEFSYLSDSFCINVIKAAPMHDLGKIAVDDAVLRKPGKFTDEEYEKMKKHSEEGARIVENVLKEVDDPEFKKIAINIAHYHHEKYDGSGYPEKIAGENIPLEARIMALADVFDALVSKRCYKDSFSYDKAFSIIEESLGTHFDPKLGKIFIQCRPQLEQLYNGTV